MTHQIIKKISANKLFQHFSRCCTGDSFGAILMFHRVGNIDRDGIGCNQHLKVTPEFLDRLLGQAKKSGYTFLGLDELTQMIDRGRPGRNVLFVTFDDGYQDNLTIASPVLRDHQVPFTIYLSPGLMQNESICWWDVLELLLLRDPQLTEKLRSKNEVSAGVGTPEQLYMYLRDKMLQGDAQVEEMISTYAGEINWRNPMLSWDEVKTMAADPLTTFGCHAYFHRNMQQYSPAECLADIRDAQSAIARATGYQPRHFAYPFGEPDTVGQTATDAAAAAGLETAVTTRFGFLTSRTIVDRLRLPRIFVSEIADFDLPSTLFFQGAVAKIKECRG